MSLKKLKLAEKLAQHQVEAIGELNSVSDDIERCEKMIVDLQTDLDAVNKKYQGPRNTREDVEYLSALLECAKTKLNWEKRMTSLQKRIPSLLERISKLMNDPECPPSDEIRAGLVSSLQAIQNAMARLQKAKGE